MTEAERALWRYLRFDQVAGVRFRRQVPIGPYIADFACFKIKLIIEVDGSQHVDAAGYDARRTAFLQERGFRVLRVWNNDMLARPESVVEMVYSAIGQ